MKKHIDSFKTVIKRVFFSEDKSLERSVAFKKNLEDKEVVNLSDKPIMIQDSKNQLGFIRKGETGFLLDGDTVKIDKKEIPIKNQETISLPVKDNFTYFVDFDKTTILRLPFPLVIRNHVESKVRSAWRLHRSR